MRIRMRINLKGQALSSDAGCIECRHRFLRRRMASIIRRMPYVVGTRMEGTTIYFMTDRIRPEAVIHMMQALTPMFASEVAAYSLWIIRNFWILWGLAVGMCIFMDIAAAYMNGDVPRMALGWVAGMAICFFSFNNYDRARMRVDGALALIRTTAIATLSVLVKNGEADDLPG